ncbi:MAG: hypothetical protein ABIQ11_01270 [Saprospiraceae bacterium]
MTHEKSNSNSRSSKILKELAKHLGASATNIKDDQYEDFLVGEIMDEEKTGKLISKDIIFKKLNSK